MQKSDEKTEQIRGPHLAPSLPEPLLAIWQARAALARAKPIREWHPQRLIICTASGIGIVATFLPWAQVPIVGWINGMHNGQGWLPLIGFAAALAYACREPRSQLLRGESKWYSGGMALVASLAGMRAMSILASARAELGEDSPIGEALAATVQTGTGLYLVVFCGLAAATVALLLPEAP